MPPLRPRPSPLPVLPLVAALLLLLAMGQMGVWLWQALQRDLQRGREAPDAVSTALKSQNPFTEMVRTHPKAIHNPDAKPRRVVVPTLPSNLQFGDPTADVVVTVLSDPGCGTCREEVRTFLNLLPRNVRVVSKFWPQDPLRSTPGVLLELARRENVAAAFLQMLDQAKGDLDDAAMLTLLEKAGVPLEKQRAALTDETGKLGQALQEDMRLGRELQLTPPPVFVVNGYVLDGIALMPDKVASYIEKLQDRKPLGPGNDYFLMEK